MKNKVNSSSDELQLITLDKNAVSFVQGELRYGSSLAELCWQHGLFDDCHVQAYLPKSLDLQKFGDLHKSIELEIKVRLNRVAERKTADVVLEYLEKDNNHLFVVETYYRYPKDKPFLERKSIPFFVFNSEVYFYLSGIRYNRDVLTSILHSARDYPFISYMTSFPEQIPIQVNTEFLHSLMDKTSRALIGAFDAEGYYLICERGKEKIA